MIESKHLQIGDRVGVILKTNGITRQCFFLGYGIYEGKQPLDFNYISSKMKRKLGDSNKEGHRFKLDNGEIYYDVDIWFMGEERFNAVFVNDEYEEGWKIINVDRKGRRRKIV